MKKIIVINNNDKLSDAVNNAKTESSTIKTNVKKLKDSIAFLNDNYDFLFNVVTGDIEYKKKNESKFKVLEDRDFRNILVRLNLSGMNIRSEQFRDLLYSEYVAVDYHPFRSYFDKLEKYDGTCGYENGKVVNIKGRDYIKEFTDQIYLANEKIRNYLVEGFRKWFVGLVVSIYDDEISMYKINQICLILVGKQAKYKTTFFASIIPKHLRNDYFYSGSFNFSDKDNERRMATKMIMSMEEMASYTKTDVEIVKAKITQDKIIVRPAFYKADLKLKRRVSFCGTQNNIEFLRDETGSRRFLIYEIENIVIDENFPLDKMYAQGLQHYRDGFRYWLNTEEINEIEKMNEKHHLYNFEYELVQANYEVPDDKDEGYGVKYLTASEIAVALSKDNNINVNNTVIKNIGSALRKLGFKKYGKWSKSGTRYLWKVKIKDTENISYVKNEEEEIF